MLDLPAAQSPPPPPWLPHAPLPGAALCLLRAGELHRIGHAEAVAASPALLAALAVPAAESGATLLAYDSSGAAWRLRHAAQDVWLMQSVADSRARLLAGLRTVLARELADRVLHELRNPLNALSLHTDLIARLLPSDDKPGDPGRARPSVNVVKQRAGDLRQRQDAAVALWLDGPPPADGKEGGLGQITEESLRLLRGHLSLQEVRLRGVALDCIGEVALPGSPAPVQIALIALLYIAGAGARQYPAANGAEVVLLAQREGQRLTLELQAPLDGRQLGREAADCDGEALLAGLALLLQPAGITLEHDAALAATRLVLEEGIRE